MLEDCGLRRDSIEIVIIESVLMQNIEESAEMLHALRRLEGTIVVDDFGTGYSSLSYLTHFPIDKLKIDRSFVRDFEIGIAAAADINAIVAMATARISRWWGGKLKPGGNSTICNSVAAIRAGFPFSQTVPIVEFQYVLATIEDDAELAAPPLP